MCFVWNPDSGFKIKSDNMFKGVFQSSKSDIIIFLCSGQDVFLVLTPSLAENRQHTGLDCWVSRGPQ